MVDLFQRIESVARRRWFGDASLLAICVVVLGLAVVLTPSTTELQLFGWDVPILCAFRRFTGFPCPGCGLTRSFVFLAHGHFGDAFRMNVFGPAAFLWVVAQIPWRSLRIWRATRGAVAA